MKRLLVTIGSVVFVILFALYAKQVIHETVQTSKPGQHYLVSLGDSVAEGAGLGGKDNGPPEPCAVMQNAFPFLVGIAVHKPVEQFACSGATVAKSSASSSLLGDQLPAAKQFIAGSDVLVNAGANDIGWLTILASCVNTNCATLQNDSIITTKLQTMQTSLSSLLTQVNQTKPRTVVVNTYYDLFAAGDACLARAGIKPTEVDFIRTEEVKLNGAITAAATSAKATVVNPDFTGHTLCSPQSWIQNMTAAAPLHPTAAGQSQIATQDTQALTTPTAL